MRTWVIRLGLVVAVAVGFAAGWLVFASPLASGPSQEDVEQAVAEQATSEGVELASIVCAEQAAPPGVWQCDAEPASDLPITYSYRVEVRGDELVVRSLGRRIGSSTTGSPSAALARLLRASLSGPP